MRQLKTYAARLPALLLLAALLTAPLTARAEIGVVLNIQPLYQENYERLPFAFGGTERTVATSGCAMVCLSMALRALRADVEQTPETLFRQAHDAGLYHGVGFSVEQIRSMAEGYGLELTSIPGRIAAVRDALMEGSPVLVATGEGVLFHKGHYVLLYGVDEDRLFTVADPSSVTLSARAYDWDQLFPDGQKDDRFFAFRSMDELENMERRVNVLVRDKIPRDRDAK